MAGPHYGPSLLQLIPLLGWPLSLLNIQRLHRCPIDAGGYWSFLTGVGCFGHRPFAGAVAFPND